MDLMAAVFSRSGFTQGYFDGKLGQEMFGHPTEGGCAGRTKGAQKLKRPGFQRCAAGRGGLCFFDVQRPAGHPVCARSRGTSGAGERSAAAGGTQSAHHRGAGPPQSGKDGRDLLYAGWTALSAGRWADLPGFPAECPAAAGFGAADRAARRDRCKTIL